MCLTVGTWTIQAHGAPPISVEVTDASSTYYNFDNRDTRRGQVASAANDHYGVFYNRFNVQASTTGAVASLRFDNAWFFTSRSPDDIASKIGALETTPTEEARQQFFRQKATEAGIELSNRFINWAYPAKYSLRLGGPSLELTLGDSYAQLGRGFVLSLRKQDELASDNTVRGIRLGARTKLGGASVRVTLIGGSLNPLRIDEVSGRYLGVSEDVTRGYLNVTEALMPRAVSTDFVQSGPCRELGTCGYAPDSVVAGQLELSVPAAIFGTQFSVLSRQSALTSDTSRTARTITTVSQSLEVPKLLQHGSLYAEFALQKLATENSKAPDLGHALYLTASWVTQKLSVILEGRNIRRLFPLSANVSNSRAREFSTLQYNAPPTTEELWNDTQFGNFSLCTTGARLKAEYYTTRNQSVFGWFGHHRSYSESVVNDHCEVGKRNENQVYTAAVGGELRRKQQRARLRGEWGARFDDAGRSLSSAHGETKSFYRELYLRYQVTEPIAGPFTLELTGFHRRRRETVGGPADTWYEGEHVTALEWGEQLALGVGAEYTTRPDVPHHYFNASVVYRPAPLLTVGFFIGQRRGAQRCVGGVCRIYPAFEGARLDATLRY